MSISPAATVSGAGYCPFPLTSDAGALGLTRSLIDTALGPVNVRHGRRSAPTNTATGPEPAIATILLHGAAGSWTTWTPLLAAADTSAPAGQAFSDLIIPDLPGWGDTPLPDAATGPISVDAVGIESLAAAAAEIAESLGYRRWRVVGHSLGGFVALELAAARPRQTVSVALVSATTFAVIDSARHPLRRFTLLPGFTALLAVMRALAGWGAPAGRFLRGLHRVGLLRPLTAPLFSRVRDIHPSVIDAVAVEARPRSFALAADRAARYDAERRWAAIDCPVRCVHGDTDVFVAATDDERMLAVIPHLTITVLGGTGHFAQVERPDDTLTALFPAGVAVHGASGCAAGEQAR